MTDDQQPAPGAAERRRSTARSAAAKRVRGDFVAQIPKRFSEGFTERIDLIIRIVFMVVVAVGCYLVLEPFLTAILIAAVLAVVTWPVFNKLRSGMRQSSTAAASVMVLSSGAGAHPALLPARRLGAAGASRGAGRSGLA